MGALTALLALPVGVAARTPVSPAGTVFEPTIVVRPYTKSLTVGVTVRALNVPTGKNVTGYYLTEDPGVTPLASDAGWKLAPTKFALDAADEDGLHTVYVWAKYTGGHVSLTSASDDTFLDQSAPTVDTFVAPSTSTSRTITVSLTGSDLGALDNSGVWKYAVVNGTAVPDLASPLWKTTAPTSIKLPKGNGNKTVTAFVRDFANNVSAGVSRVVSLDLGTPVVSITMPAYTKTRVTNINVNATDPAGAGIAGYFLRQIVTLADQDTPALNATNWKLKPTTFTVSGGAGPKLIWVWAKDGNGTISAPVAITTTLDADLPTASLTGSPTTNSRTYAVTAGGSDASSPIAKYALVNGTALPTLSSAWKDTAPTSILLPLGNGSKTVTLFVKDSAGNISSGASVTTAMTLPKPTVTLNVIPTTSESLTVAINIGHTDPGGTGMVGYIVKASNSAPAASDTGWKPQPTSFTLTAPQSDGSKTLYAWGKDKNGSVSLVSSDSFFLDRAAPTVLYTYNAGAPTVVDPATDIVMSDTGSGIKDYGVVVTSDGSLPTSSAVSVWKATDQTTTISASSGYRITIFVRDNSGHTSTPAAGVSSQLVP